MIKYKKVNLLSKEEAAYIAGIIDGEGTITLTRRNNNKSRTLVVSISNCELILLKYLIRLTGVGRIVSKTLRETNHSQAYGLYWSNRQALEIVRMTSPFLRTYKRKRAILVLKDYLMLTPRNGKYSPLLLNRREKFVQRFFLITAHNVKTR